MGPVTKKDPVKCSIVAFLQTIIHSIVLSALLAAEGYRVNDTAENFRLIVFID